MEHNFHEYQPASPISLHISSVFVELAWRVAYHSWRDLIIGICLINTALVGSFISHSGTDPRTNQTKTCIKA